MLRAAAQLRRLPPGRPVPSGRSQLRSFFKKADSDSRERVVILGTGWACFRTLKEINAQKYEIIVISPRNHLLFTPMLASSALGTVNQRSICQPVRPLVAKKKAKYVESSVRSINKEAKTVYCESPRGEFYNISYDKLIIGVGYQPNDFGIPGVKEHALFMKETADATRFKDHILERLEQAAYAHLLDNNEALSKDEEERIRNLLSFVIVGGGPTGVELAGELTDFLHQEGLRNYGHLAKFVTVHMFTYDVLGPFDKTLQEYAVQHLMKKRGVNLKLEAFVQSVEPDVVHVKRGEETFSIKYGTLVWCAGIKPQPFIKDFGCQMNDRGSQILVDANLRVKGEQDTYALGDCATIEGYSLPQTAQVANQQGIYLAKALNSRNVDNYKAFGYRPMGMMAYLGDNTGVMAGIPGFKRVTGFMAFCGWRFTYWFLQLSARNRFMLSTDWLRTLVFGRDLTRFGRLSRPT